MFMWILRVIGLIVLSQAMNRIGLRPGAKTPARSPLDPAPAVDPAQVIEAKFRPVPPAPPTPDRPGGEVP